MSVWEDGSRGSERGEEGYKSAPSRRTLRGHIHSHQEAEETVAASGFLTPLLFRSSLLQTLPRANVPSAFWNSITFAMKCFYFFPFFTEYLKKSTVRQVVYSLNDCMGPDLLKLKQQHERLDRDCSQRPATHKGPD